MEKLKTLLITGANNHDWRRSSVFCKRILEETGQFSVDLTEQPEEVLRDLQALKPYRLLFMDYNEQTPFSEEARANFEAVIRSGCGLVILHASNNAFIGWKSYESMIGMAWHAKEGSGHGEYHEFKVGNFDANHPVTKDLEPFMTWDELYHKLIPMPDSAYRILASAYSDPSKGGSGLNEPIIIVNEYGLGRCFHLTLGHVWPDEIDHGYKGNTMLSYENHGFQRILIRGSCWAAGAEQA